MHKLSFVTLLALSAVAQAGPKEEAQVHIKAATNAHKANNFEKALSELQIAYRLDPQPDLLYAIGQVYAKLGRCTEATESYAKFGKSTKDPAVKSVVEQAIAACVPREEPPAPTPAATVVTPPPEPTAVTPPPETAQVPPPEHRTEDLPPLPPDRHHKSPWYKDKLGDALVIGGAVTTIVGLVLYNSARGNLDQAEAAANLTTYNKLVDDAHAERTATVLLVATGGALVVAGVVHYVMRGDEQDTSGVGVVPATRGGLVTWGGRF